MAGCYNRSKQPHLKRWRCLCARELFDRGLRSLRRRRRSPSSPVSQALRHARRRSFQRRTRSCRRWPVRSAAARESRRSTRSISNGTCSACKYAMGRNRIGGVRTHQRAGEWFTAAGDDRMMESFEIGPRERPYGELRLVFSSKTLDRTDPQLLMIVKEVAKRLP